MLGLSVFCCKIYNKIFHTNLNKHVIIKRSYVIHIKPHFLQPSIKSINIGTVRA